MLLPISLFMVFPCEAAAVWSDNFNDKSYDGWTEISGIFSAEENTLKTPFKALNMISHPSTVATGTWSFDIYIPSGRLGQIHFVGVLGKTYDLHVGTEFIDLYKIMDGSLTTMLASYGAYSFSGWQHIDITRDEDGKICVYKNGRLVIDVIDTSITTSEYFLFVTGSPEMELDNIVVRNTVEPPQTPFYLLLLPATIGIALILLIAAVTYLDLKK